MSPLLEKFRDAHARIESGLQNAERDALPHLLAMRDDVLAHFKEKDAFYPALAEQAQRANDLEAVKLTKIFEANMKVQSGAVQRFFESLENAPNLARDFKTVAAVIRHRFEAEERSVFPLYERTETK